SVSLEGLPGGSGFSVKNLLATDSMVTMDEGSLDIASFKVQMTKGNFTSEGVSVGSGSIQAGSANLLLKNLKATSSGLDIGSGTLKAAGLDVQVEDFEFNEKSAALHMAKAELNINNTTDFQLEGLRVTSSGAVSATGGGFKAGSLEVLLSGCDFQTNSVDIAQGTLKAGSQDIIIESLAVRQSGVTVGSATIDLFGGHADIKSGDFTSQGFVAASTTLTFGSAASFGAQGLKITDHGVSLTGGSFQFGGLAVSFATSPAGTDSLDVKGKLKLPDEFSGAEVEFEFKLTSGHVQVVSGRLQVKDFAIPKTPIGLRDVDIQFDQTVIKGQATVALPVFAVTGGVEILNGRFDALTVGLSNLNIAIGDTGAFLQSVTVSGKHLSRQVECRQVYVPVFVKTFGGNMGQQMLSSAVWVMQHQNSYKQHLSVVYSTDGKIGAGYYKQETQCGIPPLEFSGTTSITAGPQEFGQSFVRVDAGTTFDDTGNFRIDGSVFCLFFKIGSAYLSVHPSGSNAGTSAGGTYIWDYVINGSGGVTVDMRGNASGHASIDLKVPSNVTLIGGMKFGSVSMSVDKSKIVGKVDALFKHITVTIQNGSFHIDWKDQDRRPWEIPHTLDIPLRDLAEGPLEKELDAVADDYIFSILTNYEPIHRIYGDDAGSTLKGSGQDVTLTEGVPTLIRINYENESGNPSMHITRPDGFVYKPGDFPFDPELDIDEAYFTANPTIREAIWAILVPETGDYTITVVHPGSLGEFVVEVLEPNAESTHHNVVALTDGEFLRVDWEDGDIDDDAEVSVWLSKNRDSYRGYLIAGPIAESVVDGSVVVNLSETILPAGLFYAAVSIDDGKNPPVWEYARDPVFIADADAPEPVRQVRAGNVEDGVMVTWEPVDDPSVIGYQVRWTDDLTKPGFPFVRSSNPEQNSLHIPGLRASSFYRFTVTPVRVRDDSKATGHGLITTLAELGDGAKSAPELAGIAEHRQRALLAQAAMVRQHSNSRDKTFARIDTKDVYMEPAWELLSDKDDADLMALSQSHVHATKKIFNINPIGTNPPIADRDPINLAFVGEPYIQELGFFDPDGADVSLVLQRGPDEAVLDLTESGPVATARIEWTPLAGDLGTNHFMVVATDEIGGRTELPWNVVVTRRGLTIVENLVVTSPRPIATVLPGAHFNHQLAVYTPDPETPLEFDILEGPAGITVNGDGLINWEPGNLDLGSYPVTVRIAQHCSNCTAGRRDTTYHFRAYVLASVLEGDLNNDGQLTEADFHLFQRILLGEIPLTESIRRIIDINDDGIIDAADLMELRRRQGLEE
ncbi:MAG: fibronectin type III domain-containing protein, partial [Candidatus Sumerlaeia bacterium]|nr:fibronectin type III domain-containing protein [Candidatus Sumerlaeia bacterium]